MICTIVMTIIITLVNGTKQSEQYAMDKDTAERIKQELPQQIAALKASGAPVKNIEIIEVREFPAFDCAKRPSRF